MELINSIGVSQRCLGTTDENGYVTVTKIYSYDLVSNPSFTAATLKDFEKIWKEKQRLELLKQRKEKLKKIFIS